MHRPASNLEVPMAKATGVETIERKELRWRMDRAEPLVLIETLPEEEYRKGHLPDAVNVPRGRIAELVPELFPDRDAEIVLYGAGTDDSECVPAALELEALGYTTVRVYDGGKKDWVEHGQPMEATAVE
jgi:rhodanese-related sulfurtransferase